MNLRKIFKNNEVNNASWLIGGKIAQMVLSLFVGVLTARYLGPSDYGLISYGTAFVTFFAALCGLGLNSVIIKDFVDHPNEQGEAIGSALFMRFLSSIASAVMTIGIVAVMDRGEPLTIVVVALCSAGAVFHVFEVFNFWFQNQYKSKITAIATLIAYVIVSAYKLILLVLQMDVRWFAAATSLDYIAVAVFLLAAYKKHNGPRLSVSKNKCFSLLKISYHYILSALMVSIYGQTDKLMLKQMLNQSAVGFYSIATLVCAMWTFVLQAVIDSVYPSILRLKKENEEAYKKKNRRLYAIVFYVSVTVSLLFLFFGDLIIKILYGAEYMPASDVLKVVTWYTAFSYLGVARNAWVVSEGHQKYLKYMYGAAAVINVVLNAVFIPLMGAVGAALASLITQIFTSIILPMFFADMRPNAILMLDGIMLKKLK